MRLIRAAPRGLAANARSSATIAGRRLVIASSARSASESANASSSWPSAAVRSLSAGISACAAISTVHGGGTTRLLEDPGVLQRPPANLHLADDVFLRHGAPVTAVRTVVPVIAHHEVIPLLDDRWAPVVVAPEFFRHIIVVQRNIVDVHVTVDNTDRV